MSIDETQNQREQENISHMYTPPKHERLSFYKPPPIIGYWVLTGSNNVYQTKLPMTGKPNWFHRMMMKRLLGWAWEDAK